MSVVFDEIVDELALGDTSKEVIAYSRKDVHHFVHLGSRFPVLLLPSRTSIHKEEGEILGLHIGAASVCNDVAANGFEPVQILYEDEPAIHDDSAVLAQQEQENKLREQQILGISKRRLALYSL